MTTRTKTDEMATRRPIVDNSLRMNTTGLNQGISGNIGARWRDGLLIGGPQLLPAEEIDRVIAKFKTYGQTVNPNPADCTRPAPCRGET